MISHNNSIIPLYLSFLKSNYIERKKGLTKFQYHKLLYVIIHNNRQRYVITVRGHADNLTPYLSPDNL